MDKTIIKMQIENNPDFIDLPRYNNSLKEFLETHRNGTTDTMICKALCITQKELEEIYHSAIIKLKGGMDVRK